MISKIVLLSIHNPARAALLLSLVLLAPGWSHLASAGSEPVGAFVLSQPSPGPPSRVTESVSDPEKVPPDWLGQVKGTIQAMEYAFTAAAGGDFSAPNRAHNLRSRVTRRGVEITPRTGDSDFRLGLRLTGFGREDAVRDVPAGTARINGTRVEIVRPNLSVTEWYLNDANGLEQGFILERRPASSAAAGTLVLRMAVEGTLSIRPMEDARGVMFSDGKGKPIVRYAELKVVDAHGAELPAQLTVAGGGLEIRVEDRDAAYPIVVDPIATTPIWTAESNQNEAEFGLSVATAGDVNGDGYSDVIVGAWQYDQGFSDEGAAFLYLGSASGMASTSPAWSGYGGQSGAGYGQSVASAGDVNGDGYSDVIVGAFLFDLVAGPLTITNMGAAYVYHGSSNTPPLAGPAWTKLGPDGEAWFGRSVAPAGDVNGDGYGDVIVGADNVNYLPTVLAPKLLVGAANGENVKAFDAATGTSLGDFTSGGPYTTSGPSDLALGGPLQRLFVKTWSAPQIDEYDGLRGDFVRTLVPWLNYGSGGLTLDPDGRIYASDGFTRISRWDVTTGALVGVFVSSGSGGLRAVGGLRFGPDGNLYVGSMDYQTGQHEVLRYSGATGAFIDVFVPSGSGGLTGGPDDLLFGPGGELFVTNRDSNNVLRYDGTSGAFLGVFASGGGLSYPYGLAFGPDGNLYVTSTGTDQVLRFNGITGAFMGVFATGTNRVPTGLIFTEAGSIASNTGQAYIYLGSASGLSGTEAWTGNPDATSAAYGRSVATAGDVNGDGYSDVIVGARGFLLGPYNDGKAFIYHGSATGVSPTPNRTITGDPGSAGLLGETVATAGDLNGDGYSDIVVSARNYANGQPYEGRIYVYYGSASGVGFAPDIREGNQDNAHFGQSVATAGDVNGDGYADLVVGIGSNQAGTGGRAVAYFGSALGLSSGPGWSVESSSPDLFGYCVATAGDVNGDGYSDIIVGAARADNGQNNEGQAYVYLGSPRGPSGIVSDWTVSGVNTYDFMAWSVASAGDVNGDGYSDVIVGMPLYDGGEQDEGRAFVYHGSANGLSTSPSWWFESDSPGANFGISVASAGDVNNDGYGDIIVGAHVIDGTFVDGGGAFVWHGGQFGLPFALPNWSAFGASTNAQFGSTVASAGDVNGDGYGDVIVGAPLDDNGQSNEGRAFAYLGSSGGLGTSSAWMVEGDQADAHLGNSVGSAGDVNGDGFSDVVVGAELYDVPANPLTIQDAGRVQVYDGGMGGLSTSPAKTLDGTQGNAQFGHVVGRAGDVNGDAYSDVFVSEQLYDDPEPDEGRVSVYHGSASGLPSAPNWFVTSNQAYSDFGSSAASAGDVNGDGYSDLIVGAVFYEGSGADDGRIFVYLGSASGLNPSAAWYRDGIQDYANIGHVVAGAGDVDGDGFGDVLAGAPGYTVGFSFAAGQAYMFYGNPNNGPGAGLPRQPNQFQYCPGICINEPISPLGLSDDTNFHLGTLARSAAGRERLKVQWEVKPKGTPFNGAGVQSGTSFLTDPPTGGGSYHYAYELANCPITESPCQWRLRVASSNPFFPRSPWLSIPANGPGEWDLRTIAGSVAVGNVLYRVNAGGPQLAAADGSNPSWRGDPQGAPSKYVNAAATGDLTFSTSNPITLRPEVPASVPMALFQTERWDAADAPEMRWSFPVSSGTYQVRLLFADIFPGTQGVGLRVFDVAIEGATVLDNYDQYAEVGGYTGTVKSFVVGVTDGSLDIDFLHATEQPAIKGIEILVHETTGVLSSLPSSLDFGAAPNPFTREASIWFTLVRGGHTRLDVYDVLGRRLRTLVDGALEPGTHRFAWEGTDDRGQRAAAGVYYARLRGDGFAAVRSIVLMP